MPAVDADSRTAQAAKKVGANVAKMKTDMNTDKIKEIWEGNGATLVTNSPAEFTIYVDQQLNYWADSVSDLGLSNF